MSKENPILILGGGLMGLALAHELAQKGRKVKIFSRRRNEAAGFVAAGMLAPHAEGLHEALLELSQLSLKRIPVWVKTIEANSGINCGLKTCGIIVPFLNATQRDKFPTTPFGHKLTETELKQEVPGIASRWKTGLLFSQDGQIDNRRRLMRALEKACVELGVHFQEGVEVLDLEQKSKTLKGITIKNAQGEVHSISGKEAILCSGAWSKQILNTIPIFPVKGQMLSLQGPKNAIKRVIFGNGTYLVPREDGLIVVGATSEHDAGFREGLTPAGQNKLHQGIQSLYPSANEWPQMERWWGFRPCTPDENPILGSCEIKGLWLATGHHRNGVLLAAITADLISRKICNQLLSDKEMNLLNRFNCNRFNK